MFEYEINPSKVIKADIALGLASYNEADNINFPTQQADIGLRKYFKSMEPVIINCDNHSPDGTKDVFLNTPTKVPKIHITTPPNTPGKGYNFENMFRKACELGVKVLICVDSDLKSITPEWIQHFGNAVLDGYDYVTPIYSRHKYDGTITNNICFPLVYGVLGRSIRQPIGGDFALSKDLMEYLIKQSWHRTTKEYGIDIFMTLNSILGGFKISEVGLGAKIHKPSAPKLGPMFLQVVSTAFLMITRTVHKWKNIENIKQCPLFGLRNLAQPQDLDVDRDAILEKSFLEYKENVKALKKFLKPENFTLVEEVFASKDNINRLDAHLWCKVVYNMIFVFEQEMDKAQVVQALRPLYFGRVVSFMNQTWDISTLETEKFITEQADIFFKNRNYLIDLLS